MPRSSTRASRSIAALSAASPVSDSTTSCPASAKTSAISAPISPAPTTPIFSAAIAPPSPLGSARRELGGAERVLALGVGNRPLARAASQHREAALHRRSRRDLVIPAFDRRIFVEIDVAALGEARRRLGGSADPREGDDVGHALFVAGEPMRFIEPAV